MAAKEYISVEEIDENFLSCTICSERYKNAKLLPCLHSFCEPCLDKLAEKSAAIICPICRRSHPLPDGGVAGICANKFINELVEQFRKREERSPKSINSCEGCDQVERVKHCVECDVDMCSNCARSHARFQQTKSHQLLTLEEYEAAKSNDPSSVQPSVYCNNHPDTQIKVFCYTCDVSICPECTAFDHQRLDHKYGYLKDAAKEYSEFLREAIDRVKVKETEVIHSKAVVIETGESLDSCYQREENKVKQHIQKTIDEVTRMVRDNGDKRLRELKAEYDRRKINLNAQLKELDLIDSDLSTAREYAQKLIHYGNAVQLMSSKKGMSAQMEELLRMETKTDPTETDYMEFKPCDDFCETKTVGIIRTFVVTAGNCKLVYVPEFVRVDEDINITLATEIKGKNVDYKEVEVGAVLTKPDDSQENIEAANNGDGTWSLETRAKMTGNHEVLVSVSKKPVKGSPVTINVMPQEELNFGQNGPEVGLDSDAWVGMVTRGGMRGRGNGRLQTFSHDGKDKYTPMFSSFATTGMFGYSPNTVKKKWSRNSKYMY